MVARQFDAIEDFAAAVRVYLVDVPDALEAQSFVPDKASLFSGMVELYKERLPAAGEVPADVLEQGNGHALSPLFRLDPERGEEWCLAPEILKPGHPDTSATKLGHEHVAFAYHPAHGLSRDFLVAMNEPQVPGAGTPNHNCRAGHYPA
jgi:hypothetical protein